MAAKIGFCDMGRRYLKAALALALVYAAVIALMVMIAAVKEKGGNPNASRNPAPPAAAGQTGAVSGEGAAGGRRRSTAPGGRMKLRVKSLQEIELYSEFRSGKTLAAVFAMRDWGTWGIKGWYLVKAPYRSDRIYKADKQLLAGENTDWEYVFRVMSPTDGRWCFSGGNHGNEKLESLELYDGASGRRLNLTPGSVRELEQLKIVEKTVLNADEFGISGYASVARQYCFTPGCIELASGCAFLKDVRLGTSYVSMFPVLKSYGRYCRYEDTGRTYQSPPPGRTYTTESFENYIGKEGTLSAVVWGDADPGLMFRIWIGGPGMAGDFSNRLKVFLWDMNKYGNKLYFSRYDTENPAQVKAGDVWSHTQGWEVLR